MNKTTNKAKVAFAFPGMALAINSCTGIRGFSIDPSLAPGGHGEVASVEIDKPGEIFTDFIIS